MAFDAIESVEIVAGAPVKQELVTKVKNNFDDHESRLSDTEAATQTLEPISFFVKGSFESFGASTGVCYKRLFSNATLTGARLCVIDAGSSGTLEVDVFYKRGAGSWTSIFSTKPSVVYTAGDLAVSTNAVLSTTDLEIGDWVRVDIVTTQVGNEEFHVYLPFQVTA